MLQTTKYKIIIYSLIGVILLTLLVFWIYFAKAQSRDYQRLADLRIWQNILSSYYGKYGTYAVTNCRSGDSLSLCLAGGRKDPLNYGSYQYSVASLSETDYEISFSLEVGIAGLKSGQYVWTKNGVKK